MRIKLIAIIDTGYGENEATVENGARDALERFGWVEDVKVKKMRE